MPVERTADENETPAQGGCPSGSGARPRGALDRCYFRCLNFLNAAICAIAAASSACAFA